jgi:hypothetical protein
MSKYILVILALVSLCLASCTSSKLNTAGRTSKVALAHNSQNAQRGLFYGSVWFLPGHQQRKEGKTLYLEQANRHSSQSNALTKRSLSNLFGNFPRVQSSHQEQLYYINQ